MTRPLPRDPGQRVPPDPFDTGDSGPVHRPMQTTYALDGAGNARWYRRTFPGTVELCPGYPRTCRLDSGHQGECSTAVRADEMSDF